MKVRQKLQAAALEMYQTKGYDLATADQIAQRAGVTERTFFRHFADKREVLFADESALAGLLAEAMRDAPPQPWAALLHVFRAAEPFFVENREMITIRGEIVSRTPKLQERELIKVRMLTLTLANGLAAKGVPSEVASLAAHLGVAAFTVALSTWVKDSDISLADRLATTFADTGRLTATPIAAC